MAVHGNDAVVRAIQTLSALASDGEGEYLVAALLRRGKKPMACCVGTPELEAAAIVAAKELTTMMEARASNHVLPPRDPNLGADYVCFNCAAGTSPFSYDFLVWLVDAEMTRRREGAPAPLKVHFWMGRDGQGSFNTPYRRQMFDNVMRPALALLGAVETGMIGGRFKEVFTSRDIVAAARAGEEVPRLKSRYMIAMQNWLMSINKQWPVTITLRESSMQLWRNSNIEAWLRLARNLQDQGEHVIIVRDTAATWGIPNFTTCPIASQDLGCRAALYELAKINLFTSNGPVILAQFGNRPYLTFQPIDPGSDYPPYRPEFWPEHFGIEVGEQWPWALPGQRIVWANDDYVNLHRAWDEWRESNNVARKSS